MTVLFALLAAVAGMLIAAQAGINNQLRYAAGTPIGAALISFLTGTAGLLLAVIITGEGIPSRDAVSSLPWWAWIGGLLGTFGVAVTILLVPRLGAATTVALNITGQMLASLVLDTFGWLGVPEEPLSAARILGAAAVLIGSGLITFRFPSRRSDQLSPKVPPPKESPLVLAGVIVLALGTGVVGPTQAAINTRLRTGLDAPLLAALISFIVGMIPLLTLVLSFRQHRPNLAKVRQEPWWIWLGGLLGAFYVASTVVIVPEIGTAAMIGFVVTGQNLASLAMDHFGWIRLPKRAATPRRIVGVLILLAGVLLIQFG